MSTSRDSVTTVSRLWRRVLADHARRLDGDTLAAAHTFAVDHGDEGLAADLASRDDLPGEVRAALASDRRAPVRAAFLARDDVDGEEAASLVAGERRASVLRSVAEHADGADAAFEAVVARFHDRPTIALATALMSTPRTPLDTLAAAVGILSDGRARVGKRHIRAQLLRGDVGAAVVARVDAAERAHTILAAAPDDSFTARIVASVLASRDVRLSGAADPVALAGDLGARIQRHLLAAGQRRRDMHTLSAVEDYLTLLGGTGSVATPVSPMLDVAAIDAALPHFQRLPTDVRTTNRTKAIGANLTAHRPVVAAIAAELDSRDRVDGATVAAALAAARAADTPTRHRRFPLASEVALRAAAHPHADAATVAGILALPEQLTLPVCSALARLAGRAGVAGEPWALDAAARHHKDLGSLLRVGLLTADDAADAADASDDPATAWLFLVGDAIGANPLHASYGAVTDDTVDTLLRRCPVPTLATLFADSASRPRPLSGVVADRVAAWAAEVSRDPTRLAVLDTWSGSMEDLAEVSDALAEPSPAHHPTAA